MALAEEQDFRPFGARIGAYDQEMIEKSNHLEYAEGGGAGQVGSKCLYVPTLLRTDTCGETHRLLLKYPQTVCAVVCDERQRPVGLVMSDDFFIQMNAEFDPEHLYELPISRLMSLHPLTVEHDLPVALARELAAARSSRTRSEAVIVTQGGVFAGVVKVEDLNR